MKISHLKASGEGPAVGERLSLLSVIIPARDEEASISATVLAVHAELARRGIPHEVIVVDDGSTDGTMRLLLELRAEIAALRIVESRKPNGFGLAVRAGIDAAAGDAVAITMADGSDDPADLARYWEVLNLGYHCVFGSRFLKKGSTLDYPPLKLAFNRVANRFLGLLFRVRTNDLTNAFKAYRKETLEGCRPFHSTDFALAVELPLKAIRRGYSWSTIPVTWRNRKGGATKFRIRSLFKNYLIAALRIRFERAGPCSPGCGGPA